MKRFSNIRKVTAYAELDPREYSSDQKKHMGGISKNGSRLLRFLLTEAALTAIGRDTELKTRYWRIANRRGPARAKVAIARILLVPAFILLRDEIDYSEFKHRSVTVRSAC